MSFAKFKRVIEEGDTVILYIGLSQIYAIEVKPMVKNKHGVMVDYTFQTKYGALRVMDLVGTEFGSKVQMTRGYAYVLYPTPELWTLTLPHRTQILYTPDISLIITELDLRPGSVVCEAGTGSGSLSHAFLRAVGSTGHLYTCDFHEERVSVVQSEFERHGHAAFVTVEARDVCESGWGRSDVADAVFLDLPRPWDALGHAVDAVRPQGGRVCSFSPCVEQVSRSCDEMRRLGLTEINTVECLQREFQFRTMVLPSVQFKQVETPQLGKPNQKNTEMSNKKQKVSSEATPQCPKFPEGPLESPKGVPTPETDMEIGEKETSEKEKHCAPKETTTTTETEGEQQAKNHKMRTAIPVLKMQGHTGFLTFATVPPRLKLRRSLKVASAATQDTSSEPLSKLESEPAQRTSKSTTTSLEEVQSTTSDSLLPCTAETLPMVAPSVYNTSVPINLSTNTLK